MFRSPSFLASSFIILTLATRLLPHPPNFTPVLAVALFGGCYFKSKKTAMLIPFCALVLSDLILGFHSLMWAVYLGFAATIFLGIYIKNEKTPINLVLTGLGGTLFFFFITNFAVWIQGSHYPKTWLGLVECYTMALPFLRNSLLGNFVYITAIFTSYELAHKKILCQH